MTLGDIFKQRFRRHPERMDTKSLGQFVENQAPIENTKPFDIEEYSIQLEDDQIFQVNVASLFPQSSRPFQEFHGKGLPQWAQIDAAKGIISGTVTHDASVFGRSKVLVTAKDRHKNEVALTVILCPQNLAAIADITVHDCEIGEQSSFEIRLESLFYDPFTECEPKTICVSGLPRGLEFKPEHNSISGEALQQTAKRAPYVVTVWAQTVQSRLIRQHFLLKVTSARQEQPVVNHIQADDRCSEIRAVKLAKLRNALVTKKTPAEADTQSTGSVWQNGEIEGGWGIKMPNDPEMESVSPMIPEEMEIDWTETVDSLKQKQKREGLSEDGRLNRITIDALRRQNKLYLEFQNSLDAVRDGRVTRALIRGKDGTPLPAWMKMVREDFVTASLPPDVRAVDLELNVEFGNGNRLVKPMRIEF